MFYSPAQLAERYPGMAKYKVAVPFPALLARGILAGALVALASFGAHVVSTLIADQHIAKLVGALLFPSGLAMILLVGGELFTGTSMMVLGVYSKTITVPSMLKNWGIVYLGNFIGAFIIAALTTYMRRADPAFLSVAIAAAEAKAALPWGDAVLRGVICNILVCAAVWMSYTSENAPGKLMAMYAPVMLFVLCGTEHCVTNMYYFPAAFFAGGAPTLTIPGFLLNNLLPVTLGNIIGGGFLFSTGLWFALFPKKG